MGIERFGRRVMKAERGGLGRREIPRGDRAFTSFGVVASAKSFKSDEKRRGFRREVGRMNL